MSPVWHTPLFRRGGRTTALNQSRVSRTLRALALGHSLMLP